MTTFGSGFGMDGVAAKKNALLQEFDTTIAPQKLQIAQTLPQLLRACYEPTAELAFQAFAAPLAATASAQRPAVKRESSFGYLSAAPGSQPAAKRNKLDDFGKRAEELFKGCSALLSKLSKRKEVRRPLGIISPDWRFCPSYPAA